MKKIYSVIMTITLIFAFNCVSYARSLETYDWSKISSELSKYMKTDGLSVSPYTKIYVNNNEVKLDIPPILVNGKMLIPLRKASEMLGFKVSWQSSKIILNENSEIQLEVGNKEAIVSSILKKEIARLDVPPFTVDGNTLVPLRFISENLGANVFFDRKLNTVFIKRTDITTRTFVYPGQYSISYPAYWYKYEGGSSNGFEILQLVRKDPQVKNSAHGGQDPNSLKISLSISPKNNKNLQAIAKEELEPYIIIKETNINVNGHKAICLAFKEDKYARDNCTATFIDFNEGNYAAIFSYYGNGKDKELMEREFFGVIKSFKVLP